MIYLGMALVFGLLAVLSIRGTTERLIVGVLVFLLNLVWSWFSMPTLSYGFLGIPFQVVLNGVILLAIGMQTEEKSTMIIGGAAGAVGAVFLFVLPFFASAALFHASEYRNLIQVKKGTFSTDTTPISIEHIRRVDEETADKVADKLIGKSIGLGSREQVGKLHIQKVNGELYWVGALEHSDFFKWLNNSSEGTQGYVMVSAVDEGDARLVLEVGGKPLGMKYIHGSYFGQDPERYLYEHGYASTPLTDFTFELDDAGRPYIVATKYAKRIGYGGPDATGVVILDVQTGQITESKGLDDIPKWVDRVQPEDFMVRQLDNWGSYVHGYWNALFGGNDMVQTTSDKMSLVYGNDDRSYWYTSLTSHGKDESSSGFVLTDTRTKVTKLYLQAGATEDAAKASATGLFQKDRYVASQPILYNVGGLPTYFIPMKDEGGLVKAFAFVSVTDYTVVGGGSNLQSALQSYEFRLSSTHERFAPQGRIDDVVIRDAVSRIKNEPSQDGVIYYLVLNGHKNKLFAGSRALSPELIVTEPGDSVSVAYKEGGNEVVNMIAFDNHRFQFQKTKEQLAVEKRSAVVKEREEAARAAQDSDATWENLTPEQKVKLMRKTK